MRSQKSRRTEVDIPSSCVYDGLGLNSRSSPFRTFVAILAKRSGCFERLHAPDIAFSQKEPQDMSGVRRWLATKGQFDMDAYRNCCDMILPEQLPFPLDVEIGWLDCWVRLLDRYAHLYLGESFPFASHLYADLPMIELVFAIYATSQSWRAKARRISPPEVMEAEEDQVHCAGQSLLVEMMDASELINLAPKSNVKRISKTRNIQLVDADGAATAEPGRYTIQAKADGRFRINGEDVISDAKRCAMVADDSVLQALIFSYMYETRFAMIVCCPSDKVRRRASSTANTKPRIFALDCNEPGIRHFRNTVILGGMDELVGGLCGHEPKAFLARFLTPAALRARERAFLEMLHNCEPTDTSPILGASHSQVGLPRIRRFQQLRKKLSLVPALPLEPASPIRVALGQWTALQNIDCFRGHDAFEMLVPEVDGIAACRRVCSSRNFGGFCVYRGVAYFRSTPPHFCVGWACSVDDASFHLAPIRAENRHLVSEDVEILDLDGAASEASGARSVSAKLSEEECAQFTGPHRNTCFREYAEGEDSTGYATLAEAKLAALKNDSAGAITLTQRGRYTLRKSNDRDVSICWERSWIKTSKALSDSFPSASAGLHGSASASQHAELVQQQLQPEQPVDEVKIMRQGTLAVNETNSAEKPSTAGQPMRSLRIWDQLSFGDPYRRKQGLLLRHLPFFVAGSIDLDGE